MHATILGFITAFTLTFNIIPLIIQVARERRLYDKPNERSAHIEPTPSLGGIGIFAGAICAIVLWTPLVHFGVLQYILAAFVLIFLIGVMDDLLPMSPTNKFLGQILVAIILAYKANVRITSLYGVLGIYEIPEIVGFVLSIIVIVAIINAFNLIDGINGLAGSIGLLACMAWGFWFYLVKSEAFSVVAFSLAGAIIAFLKYNYTPAKIFMGDTGSLLIGTVCSILAISFIEINQNLPVELQHYSLHASPAVAIAILILPLFDTSRVFTIRLLEGKSPFHPDKNHIHHLLLRAGMSHMQATGALVAVNICFILIALLISRMGTIITSLVIIGLAVLLSSILAKWSSRKAMVG